MQIIELSAETTIQATAGDADKPVTISLLAYSGNVMKPPGWPELVIDLSGLSFSDNVPLLSDHANSIASVAGSGTPHVINGSLSIEGTLARGTDAANRIIALSKAGVKLGASVGVEPSQQENIRGGTVVTVNNRTLTAGPNGLTIIRAGRLREVSIVPVGADASAGISKLAASQRHSEAIPMNTTISDPSTHGTNVLDPISDERQRLGKIDAMCAGAWGSQSDRVEELRAAAIAGTLDEIGLQAGLLSALRDSRTQFNYKPNRGDHSSMSTDSIEAALMIRAGRQSLAEKNYSPQTLDSTRTLRSASLVDICSQCCRIDGRDPMGMRKDEIIRAAFSTTSLTTALSNVTGKQLWEAYRESTASWRGFAKVLPAADFKPQVGVRPSFVGQLEPIGPTGEVKHGQLAESAYPWSIGTFARQLQLTRQDVINDDLSFVQQTAPLLGKMAARSLNDLVWSTIMANGGSFFAGGNSNLLTTGSAFSLTSLSNAITAMRKQRDAEGNDLDIMPRVLAVPPELEIAARAALNSEEISAAINSGDSESTPTGNALRNIALLVVESRLSNTTKFANADTDGWYLFGGPMDAPVVVGFLDGNEVPIVEFFGLQSNINVLGVGWRVYFDFGCALGDFRAAVKATGQS